MALSVEQLLSAIRAVPEGQDSDASIMAIGTRLLAVGRALVDHYAPNAPVEVRDEAVIRIAGYLYDAPNVTRTGVAWNESGAHALVDPWVERGVAPIDFDFDVSSIAADAAAAGVDEEAVEAIVRRLVADWAEAGNEDDVPAEKLPDSAGVDAAAVQRLIETDDVVVAHTENWDAARYETRLFNGPIRVAASDAAYALGGNNPNIPGAENARRLRIVVDGTAMQTINLSALAAKPAAAVTDQLSSRTAVAFSHDGTLYFLARTAGGKFLFSADSVGTYQLQIFDSRIDLEDFARRSHAAKVPEAKLPGETLSSFEHAAIDLFLPGHSLARTLIASGNPAAGQARLGAGYLEIEKGTDAAYFNDLSDKAQIRFWIWTSDAQGVPANHLVRNVTSVTQPAGRPGNIRLNFGSGDTPVYQAGAAIAPGPASITVSTPDYNDIARTPPAVSDWAEEGNTDAIPAGKLTNAPSSGGGLSQAAVDARVKAGVADWAETADTSNLPAAKLPDIPLANLPADLQLIDRNITAGGWRGEAALQISAIQAAAYTLATARTAAYVAAQTVPTGPLANNQNIAVRVARTLFNAKPTAEQAGRLRVALDDIGGSVQGVVALLSTAAYLGASADNQYDYYNLPLPDVPSGSTPTPQYDAPTELDNIAIPASSIEDLPPQTTAGVIELLDGNIVSPNLTNFSGAHQTPAVEFAGPFDLDDHPHGIFEATLRIQVATHSTTLSFADGETIVLATASGLAAATDVAAAEDFTRAGAVEGVAVISQPVYAVGQTYVKIGDIRVYLVHDSDNHLAYVVDFVPASGHGQSGNATFSSHLTVAFQKADAPAAAGGATVGLGEIVELDSGAGTHRSTRQTALTRSLPTDYQKYLYVFAFTPQNGRSLSNTSVVFLGAQLGSYGTIYLNGDNALPRLIWVSRSRTLDYIGSSSFAFTSWTLYQVRIAP